MKQTLTIRKEIPSDYHRVIELTEKAFETLEISEHNEGQLILAGHQKTRDLGFQSAILLGHPEIGKL